jgi:hypothetical protein
LLTTLINNTGFGLNGRACVFLKRQYNLWGFALNKEKKKQNQKILALFVAESQR